MKKILALLAAIVAATPVQAAFVVPETAPAPSKEYTISGLEWRGCVVKPKYEGTSDIPAECFNIFRAQPSFHSINWKNARRCEDYTPGCVELEGIVKVDGVRYVIDTARRHFSTRRMRWYTRLDVKVIKTDIKYQDYKINCLDTYASIGTLDWEGNVDHIYTAKKFQKDVCDSVFPEPEKDTAYVLKEIACNMTKDPEEKKKRCDKFEEWKNRRRWQ